MQFFNRWIFNGQNKVSWLFDQSEFISAVKRLWNINGSTESMPQRFSFFFKVWTGKLDKIFFEINFVIANRKHAKSNDCELFASTQYLFSASGSANFDFIHLHRIRINWIETTAFVCIYRHFFADKYLLILRKNVGTSFFEKNKLSVTTIFLK